MKKLSTFFFLVCLISSSLAQDIDESNDSPLFGVALNSRLSGVVGEISIAPTGIIYVNNHQLELGACLYPYNLNYPRMIGGSFDYKYFPNGIANRFNLYFGAHLNFTNEFIDYEYIINNSQTTINYLSMTIGYGFEVKILGKGYIGTSLNFGMNTNSRFSTDPQYQQWNRELFEAYEMDGAIHLHIGYRF